MKKTSHTLIIKTTNIPGNSYNQFKVQVVWFFFKVKFGLNI